MSFKKGMNESSTHIYITKIVVITFSSPLCIHNVNAHT